MAVILKCQEENSKNCVSSRIRKTEVVSVKILEFRNLRNLVKIRIQNSKIFTERSKIYLSG